MAEWTARQPVEFSPFAGGCATRCRPRACKRAETRTNAHGTQRRQKIGDTGRARPFPRRRAGVINTCAAVAVIKPLGPSGLVVVFYFIIFFSPPSTDAATLYHPSPSWHERRRTARTPPSPSPFAHGNMTQRRDGGIVRARGGGGSPKIPFAFRVVRRRRRFIITVVVVVMVMVVVVVVIGRRILLLLLCIKDFAGGTPEKPKQPLQHLVLLLPRPLQTNL